MPQQPQQNFDAMRQDAIRRSREMQRRAMPSAPDHYRPPEPPPEQPPLQEMPPPPPEMHESGKQGLLQSLNLPEEFNGLLKDWNGEKLALAGLLYLLYKEGADISLLLALAYILL